MEQKRRVLSLLLSFLEINYLEKILWGWKEVLWCISMEIIEGAGMVLWE